MEVLESLIGEHDSPAEGVIGTVALEDSYLMRRIRLREKQRRVQSSWPAADDYDFQDSAVRVTGVIHRSALCSRALSAPGQPCARSRAKSSTPRMHRFYHLPPRMLVP